MLCDCGCIDDGHSDECYEIVWSCRQNFGRGCLTGDWECRML